MPKRSLALLAGVLLALLGLLAPPLADAQTESSRHDRIDSARDLREAVEVDGIVDHLEALQEIADENDGTRASGTPGYEASVDYVVRKLRRAGYRPQVQEFTFPFFQQLGPSTFEQESPNPTTYVEGTDYFLADFSGSGEVTAPLQAIDLVLPPTPAPSSTSGCEDTDFAGFTAGNIALIQRGTCTFGEKVANAVEAGAVGVVLFNEGQPGRTDAFAGTLGGPTTIPVVMPSFAIGNDLAGLVAAGPVSIHIATSTLSEDRQTWNVLADTRQGRADRTVVVGAHLDSVVAGPGINDNGTGSSTILEIAEELGRVANHGHGRDRGHGHDGDLRNRVRFAFWGAEESNLLGSTHYVANLSEAQLAKIALNLNFDMVGSVNSVNFVYDGDGSDIRHGRTARVRPRSRRCSCATSIAKASRRSRRPSTDAVTTARSSTSASPPVACSPGAEGVKTAEQAAIFGGTAGEPYDPCYHQACDTIDNVDDGGPRPDGRRGGARHVALVARSHPGPTRVGLGRIGVDRSGRGSHPGLVMP